MLPTLMRHHVINVSRRGFHATYLFQSALLNVQLLAVYAHTLSSHRCRHTHFKALTTKRRTVIIARTHVGRFESAQLLRGRAGGARTNRKTRPIDRIAWCIKFHAYAVYIVIWRQIKEKVMAFLSSQRSLSAVDKCAASV